MVWHRCGKSLRWKQVLLRKKANTSYLNNFILGRFFFSLSFNCIYFILIEANNSAGLRGNRTMGLLLCGCISCQMLISHIRRFNIYEIRQIDSRVILESTYVLVTVNSQQGRSKSALLEYSEVTFVCMLFVWGFGWLFLSPGQLKVKFEEKPGQCFGSWIVYSTVHIWLGNKEKIPRQ